MGRLWFLIFGYGAKRAFGVYGTYQSKSTDEKGMGRYVRLGINEYIEKTNSIHVSLLGN